jgi:hypothetical protein
LYVAVAERRGRERVIAVDGFTGEPSRSLGELLTRQRGALAPALASRRGRSASC